MDNYCNIPDLVATVLDINENASFPLYTQFGTHEIKESTVFNIPSHPLPSAARTYPVISHLQSYDPCVLIQISSQKLTPS